MRKYLAFLLSLFAVINSDIEFHQDGTRLNETSRNALDISHRNTLSKQEVAFTEINGNWQDRFEKAIEEISNLIAQ